MVEGRTDFAIEPDMQEFTAQRFVLAELGGVNGPQFVDSVVKHCDLATCFGEFLLCFVALGCCATEAGAKSFDCVVGWVF